VGQYALEHQALDSSTGEVMTLPSKDTTATRRISLRRLSKGFAIAGAGVLVAGIVTAPPEAEVPSVWRAKHRGVSLAALTLPLPIPAGAITGGPSIIPTSAGDRMATQVSGGDLPFGAALEEPSTRIAGPLESAALSFVPPSWVEGIYNTVCPINVALCQLILPFASPQNFLVAAALVGAIVVGGCRHSGQPRGPSRRRIFSRIGLPLPLPFGALLAAAATKIETVEAAQVIRTRSPVPRPKRAQRWLRAEFDDSLQLSGINDAASEDTDTSERMTPQTLESGDEVTEASEHEEDSNTSEAGDAGQEESTATGSATDDIAEDSGTEARQSTVDTATSDDDESESTSSTGGGTTSSIDASADEPGGETAGT
jgi:hypothetical protein